MITTEETQPNGDVVHHMEIRWEARNSKGWELTRTPVTTKGLAYSEQAQLKGKGPMAYSLWNPETGQTTEWCSCGHTLSVSYPAVEMATSSTQGILQDRIDSLIGQFKDQAEFSITRLDPKLLLEVAAEGMRATRAGSYATGDQRRSLNPDATTIETWYAPAMHLELSTIVTDSKAGITTNSITALGRGEPNPDLFQTPNGYTIKGPRKHDRASVKLAASEVEAEEFVEQPVKAIRQPAKTAKTAEPMLAMNVAYAKPVAAPVAPAPARTAALPLSALIELTPAGGLVPATKPLPIAKSLKPKVYKNTPPGWPPGLPPL